MPTRRAKRRRTPRSLNVSQLRKKASTTLPLTPSPQPPFPPTIHPLTTQPPFPLTIHPPSPSPISLLIITPTPSQPLSDTPYQHIRTNAAIPSLLASQRPLSPTNGKPLHWNTMLETQTPTSMSRYMSPTSDCTRMKMLLCVRLSLPSSKDQT